MGIIFCESQQNMHRSAPKSSVKAKVLSKTWNFKLESFIRKNTLNYVFGINFFLLHPCKLSLHKPERSLSITICPNSTSIWRLLIEKTFNNGWRRINYTIRISNISPLFFDEKSKFFYQNEAL